VRVEVRRLLDDEWTLLREVRLAALRDAPYAFNSAYGDEVTHDEATWRRRLREQAWFLALDGERPVGVASGGHLRGPSAAVRTLRSMWVTPERRGSGAASALVDAVALWAAADGASTLTLWATEHAARARSFYSHYGFTRTGEERPMGVDHHVTMSRFAISI